MEKTATKDTEIDDDQLQQLIDEAEKAANEQATAVINCTCFFLMLFFL